MPAIIAQSSKKPKPKPTDNKPKSGVNMFDAITNIRTANNNLVDTIAGFKTQPIVKPKAKSDQTMSDTPAETARGKAQKQNLRDKQKARAKELARKRKLKK